MEYPESMAVPIITEAVIQGEAQPWAARLAWAMAAVVAARETMIKVRMPAECRLVERSYPIIDARAVDRKNPQNDGASCGLPGPGPQKACQIIYFHIQYLLAL